MYPNLKVNMTPWSRQQGSVLAFALFVIVLMSALVLGLLSQQLSSSTAVSYEVQGNRAFNAAQSGLQRALVQLYPLTGVANCSAISPSISFAGAGLADCQAELRCERVENPQDANRPLYRLQSTGTCEATGITSSRVVTMDAY